MIGRREILKVIAGVTAMTTVKSTSGVGSGSPNIGKVSAAVAAASGKKIPSSPEEIIKSKIKQILDEASDRGWRESIRDEDFDVDIRTKKSWSPAFKAHLQSKRNRMISNIEKALYGNDDNLDFIKLAKLLSIPMGENKK